LASVAKCLSMQRLAIIIICNVTVVNTERQRETVSSVILIMLTNNKSSCTVIRQMN